MATFGGFVNSVENALILILPVFDVAVNILCSFGIAGEYYFLVFVSSSSVLGI